MMDNKKAQIRNPRMDSDTNLEAEHRLKQASTFKKLSALSPGAISPHDNGRTQGVLRSHLTAGNLSINLLKRPLLSKLATPLPKRRD